MLKLLIYIFALDTTPPKQVLKNGKMTFIEAGFVPTAIVHVGVESSHTSLSLLSEDILKEARSGLEAEIVVAKKRELKQLRQCYSCLLHVWRNCLEHDCTFSFFFRDPSLSSLPSQRPRPAKSQTSGGSRGTRVGGGGASAAGEARKVPKWFKMGKHKTSLSLSLVHIAFF